MSYGAIMKFNLKKYNTSGITYKDDGQIPKNKIKEGEITNTNSIVFEKPYKLQIRASKMIDGKRLNNKKTMTFPITITLLDAVKEASRVYDEMMSSMNNMVVENDLQPSTLFSKVFGMYVESKVKEHDGDLSKKPYDKKGTNQFLIKWLSPIANKRMDEIKPRDIDNLRDRMKDKNGNHLSMRTKLAIHQYVNPIYTYFRLNSDYELKSPAMILKKHKVVSNTRSFDLSIDEIASLFKELKDYPITPVREIFMWLMHGRRRNEVLSLEWSDIDLDKNTYTIQAQNNKARIAMTYTLSDRLRATLEVIGIKQKGLVFNHFSHSTLRGHWDRLVTNKDKTKRYDLVLHQLRSCVIQYLKNKHGVSNELSGFVVGHTQTSSVTERYGTYGYKKLNDTLNLMLDEVFDEAPKVDEKLKQLQIMFPDKSMDQLQLFLNMPN